MCVVIDANCFSPVFNKEDQNHADFKPVKDWLFNLNNDAKVVYGGKKYKQELANSGRYRKIFKELHNIRKAIEINGSQIDHFEEKVKDLTQGTGFNDSHIIAIFIVSRCRLLCSDDEAADRFIKDKDLYPAGQRRPSIYRGHPSHRRLLNSGNIVPLQNTV